MNKFAAGAAAVLLAATGYLASVWFHPQEEDDDAYLSDEIMYICPDTGQTIRGPRDNPPAPGSLAGCKTLVQALYCPKCGQWSPMPPPAALELMPTGPRCRLHNEGLLEEIPDSAVAANQN